MKAHPYADLFPLMDATEYEALKADIQANGQKTPILMLGNLILDGRNRWRACVELGLKPNTQQYYGNDPLAQSLSLNLNRRHLTASQRAIIAVEVKKLRSVDNPLLTDEVLAKEYEVTRPVLSAAKVVLEKGTPELQAEVREGRQSVMSAAKVAQGQEPSKPKGRPKGQPTLTKYQRVLRDIDGLTDEEKAQIGEAYCPKCQTTRY